MPLDDASSRSDGLDGFPMRFDDTWQSYDSEDLNALSVALPALGVRFDETGIFFARALDYVKARTYMRQLPSMSADRLVPTSNDTPVSAQSVTFVTYDEVGMAKIIANYADDLPRADVRGREVSVKVHGIGDSYGYSTQDLRVAAATGTGLPTRKADAARNAVARKENSLKIRGDAAYGMFGLANHPNIPTVTAAVGDWGNASTDGNKILADINALLDAVVNQSNGVHSPTVLGLSVQSARQMNTKRITGGQQETVGEIVRRQYPGLEIVTVQELKGIGAGGTNMAFAAERDMDNYYYDQVMQFVQHPPQARNLEFVVPCEARTAGLIVIRPLSMAVMGGL